jgi:predicted nucleotidyltransferase
MAGEGDLFDLVAVKLLLEEALGRKVDVVSAGGLTPGRRDTVLRDVRYAARRGGNGCPASLKRVSAS